MKILITGCRGQLGTELQHQLSAEGCAIGPLPERLRKATVIPVDVDELDITDREATINYIRRHQPDTVINCAAFTNVDGCETARDAAFKVNAIGPRNLALACEKVNARLIHISTDYVFPGTANGGVALDECAVPAPISAYGQTKLLGEQYVERFCRRHFIVRTAWLYSSYGKNFVKTMIRLGRTHDKITVVNDQLGNPTNAVDLAYHILKLAVSHDYGIYHCTGNGICSWYDFACAIMQGAGLSCKVEPVTSAEYAAATPASASRLRGIFVCISGILWYNIGREFPIGGVRMNTLSRTEIEQVIRELLHKYHAEYALLFGSYARGEATAASDIDVIVVGGANFRARDIFAFGEELRQRTQKDVDAFEIREVNTGTPFYESIMREGVKIA